jgi:hypothetical protein
LVSGEENGELEAEDEKDPAAEDFSNIKVITGSKFLRLLYHANKKIRYWYRYSTGTSSISGCRPPGSVNFFLYIHTAPEYWSFKELRSTGTFKALKAPYPVPYQSLFHRYRYIIF